MATSAEQINDLIAGYTALKAYFEGQKDTWDGDVAVAQAAYNALANNLKGVVRQMADETVYVDQVSGDDTNAGTAASPFQTIGRAATEGIKGGTLRIGLLSDYHLDDYVFLPSYGAITIVGEGAIRNLTFADVAASNNTLSPHLRFGYVGGVILLSNLTVHTRKCAETVIGKYMIRTTGRMHVMMNNVVLAPPQVDDDLPILSGNHVFSFAVAETPIPTEWQGRIVEGVPAGTLAADVLRCAATNLNNF